MPSPPDETARRRLRKRAERIFAAAGHDPETARKMAALSERLADSLHARKP